MKKPIGLLTVQSLIGTVLVLACLLLRLSGSPLFEELKTAFHEAIADDSLAQTLSQVWDNGA